MKVTILGAGAYGTALGGVLTDNGYDIDYYDPRVKKEKLSATTARAKAILVCVPSSTIAHVLPYLPKELPLIVATKGILSDRIFEEFRDWMVMSGPGYAEDIKARKMTHLTATDKRIIEMFGTKYLDFDETDDRGGVLMCGALKNVYAILAGMLKLQPKTREYRKFLADAAFEMKIILEFNDCELETVELNCGKGDLRITCDYPSRNYEFGRQVAEKGYFEPEKTVEGLTALKRLRRGEIAFPKGLKLMGQILRESEKWG
ncbi:hypothetical protein IKF89_02475 [Candidatus Saccharibacteria bacterium]|nr:hypothetical protein [Candidatus Saccharibacteria bacterium]